MRDQRTMMELIIKVAKKDERILAAYLGGSRVNPMVKPDIFQDYDVVYVVSNTLEFQNDPSWIDCFGERLYMQYPEESVQFIGDRDHCYGWLMQFADGNRLDLHVCTLDYVKKDITRDRMYQILLDKINCLPEPEELSDKQYWVQKPSRKEYLETCNEFWWCMNNVAKGLWRKETLYVMDMVNENVRPMLRRMLEWKAGLDTDFSISVGKSGKYLEKWLPTDIWNSYLKTYSKAEIPDIWSSVFIMCDLFDETALLVGQELGFSYHTEEAKSSRNHLIHVLHLPDDAVAVY